MVVTEFKGLKSDEKLLLVLLLGTLDALHQKKIEPEEVQRIMPFFGRVKDKVSKKVVALLAESWELEDANDLVPEFLEKSIEILRTKTLRQLSKYEAYPDHVWLDLQPRNK